MDGHGEQPGPTPGGGAGRSDNLQGGAQVDDYMDGHGEQPGGWGTEGRWVFEGLGADGREDMGWKVISSRTRSWCLQG